MANCPFVHVEHELISEVEEYDNYVGYAASQGLLLYL